MTNFDKAVRYLEMGNYEKSEELLKMAISECEKDMEQHEYELNPSIEIYCCYGELLYELNRTEEATCYLNKVIDYYNENGNQIEMYDMAMEVLSKIIDKD